MPALGAKRPATEVGPFARPGGRRPTILQVLPALGAAGGVERGAVEIAEAVVEAGGQALVAAADGPQAHELRRVGAVHVPLPLHSKNPLVMLANVDRLADLIQKEAVDLIHARSRAPAWSAHFAALRTGIPFVTTFHGTYGRGNWIKHAYNSVMTKGERVIAISDFIGVHVRREYGVPAGRLRVVPRGVDLRRFHPERVSAERLATLADAWRLGDGLPVVMLPGRLTRWKGQSVFIDAVSRLGRRDIHCLLVGPDQGRTEYRRELEALVDRRGLGGLVRIAEHCDDMPAAYMLTDVVVSASTDPEAFGRVIAEAQALGRPVVATDQGGARETVIEGETGWLVRPGDAAALAAALRRALALTTDQRETLARKAIAHVHRNFSKEVMCAKTLAVYDEVLGLEARH